MNFGIALIFAAMVWSEAQPPQEPGVPTLVRAEAHAGHPFGVGVVSFRLPSDRVGPLDPAMLIRTGAVQLVEKNNRSIYPTFGQPPTARFFRGIFGRSEDPTDELISCWFLFRGDEPLTISILGCRPLTFVLEPQKIRENKGERLLKSWYREYVRGAEAQTASGDYPDLIEAYLMSMLASRLGMTVPRNQREKEDPLVETFNLLMDVESIRSDLVRGWFGGKLENEPATLPPPPAIQWTAARAIGLPQIVDVEPMASHVPVDCFYFRFGTWNNQLWVKKLMEEFGGDLSRMVKLRGYQARVNSKFLNQLALESSQLDEWFGGNLIQDVAIIGSDTYFSSGPAVGVLLHSKNTQTLLERITAKRQRFATDHGPEVNFGQVKIVDQSVSLISTLDNRYRSFHVVDGDFHLITNSRALAEKFLVCQTNGQTLGESAEFRYIRHLMPIDRDDTVFAYLSSAFFQQLLTPQYQIELRRRSQVIAEMQIIELARMAAGMEGFTNAPTEYLAGNGFLPAGFDRRTTASQLIETSDGWVDTVRGRRGFFLPIPDTPMDMVTKSEIDWYSTRAQFFTEDVRELDPLAIAIKRYQQGDSIERVVFDGRIAPVGQKKYGWFMDSIGEPLKVAAIGGGDEVVRLHASLREGVWNRSSPAHQMFAAIQNEPLPPAKMRAYSMLESWQTIKEVPGYLGGWPKPGAVDWMPKLGSEPDENGYTFSRFLDLWRLQFDDFALLAFEQERLERLKQTLHIEPYERSAQVRLEIRDPSQSRLRDWVNVVNYRRSWQTSVANIKMLNTLIQQFGVPIDRALETAETLLDVKLVCSLSGKYEVAGGIDRSAWISSAWPVFASPAMPVGYTAPFLTWFRGLELEVTKLETQFSVHGYIDIQRDAKEPTLPSFDLFKGFQNLIPGMTPNAKPNPVDKK